MNRLLSILAMLFAAVTVNAQVTAKTAFTSAPKEVFPTIPSSVRLDMIDYFESGISRPSANLFGSDVIITGLTDNVITLKNGSIQKVAIIVLPGKSGEIIMTISDLETPATDSEIKFYNSRWEEYDDQKFFANPSLADWTGKLSKTDRASLENMLPFLTFSAVYDPATMTLTLTPTIGDYVAENDRQSVDNALKPSLSYKWNRQAFKPVR